MRIKATLSDSELPRQWYNLAADLPGTPNPPLAPDGSPLKPEQLSALFPEPLIEQEVSSDRWIDIPEEVLEILARWRPTPLVRARNLGKSPRHASSHLLQERKPFPDRKPQAKYCGTPSLL